MALLSPQPRTYFRDATGKPLAAGTVVTNLAGTNKPAITFQDAAETTANTNPIVLDAAGSASIYLAIGVYYDFIVTSADASFSRTYSGITVGSVTVTEESTTDFQAVLTEIINSANRAIAAGNTATGAASSAKASADAAKISAAEAKFSEDVATTLGLEIRTLAEQTSDYTRFALGSGNQIKSVDLGCVTSPKVDYFPTDFGKLGDLT